MMKFRMTRCDKHTKEIVAFGRILREGKEGMETEWIQPEGSFSGSGHDRFHLLTHTRNIAEWIGWYAARTWYFSQTFETTVVTVKPQKCLLEQR